MRLNSFSIIALLPAMFAGLFLYSGTAEASSIHPWELHPYRFKGHRVLDVSDADVYNFYYNSPERSITHGLHPANRRRYYNPRPYVFVGDHGLFGGYGELDIYEFDARTGRWMREKVAPQPAVGSDCTNYSFQKPNYRVPPYGYRCEK